MPKSARKTSGGMKVTTKSYKVPKGKKSSTKKSSKKKSRRY